MARQVLENGVILPAEYSDDWYDDMTSNLTKLDDVIGSDSEKLSSSDVGAAALSNNYNDLDNLPTIPTVNDATLTIQKNGVDVQTFTANASSNVTANITVPTKTSDLTNDSNFVDTSNSAVSSGITSAKVTSYDTHIADTNIHVTTADKNRWNNQTYVFRYSSTALTPSSTNSNTLLDNTDNLKIGDKVIDSSGVLFSITAIDTQNSTFTIGTALIDLAQDSDVVHKRGSETVGGNKTFTGISEILRTSGDHKLKITDTRVTPLDPTGSITSNIAWQDTTGRLLGTVANVYDSSGKSIMQLYTRSFNANDEYESHKLRIISNKSGSSYADVDVDFLPSVDNSTRLGSSTIRWQGIYATNYYYGSTNVEFSTKFVTTDTAQTVSGNKTFSIINGVEPSSLSLPSDNSSNVVDISSYITYFDGTLNRYVPPANGWIVIYVNNCTELYMKIDNLWGKNVCRTDAGKLVLLMPVPKGKGVDIQIFATGTLRYARFVPCQGNV